MIRHLVYRTHIRIVFTSRMPYHICSVSYSYSGTEYEYDMNIFEYILVIDWSRNLHPNQPTTGSCSFSVGSNVNLEPSDATGAQQITKSRGLAHPNIGITTFTKCLQNPLREHFTRVKYGGGTLHVVCRSV